MLPREIASFPLSFAQERLWLFSRLRPESSAYNLAIAWLVHGRVELPALQSAVAQVQDRHESLRTVFRSVDGVARQIVLEKGSAAVETIQLDGVSPTGLRAAGDEWIRVNVVNSFDLERGPLFRVTLLRASKLDAVLVLLIHHIVTDGQSISIFARELTELYASFVARRTPTLTDLSYQYGDFASWQRTTVQEDLLEELRAYWTQVLAGSHCTTLPADHLQRDNHDRASLERFEVPEAAAGYLRALMKSEKLTLFNVTLATYIAYLSRYLSARDVIVGIPFLGRPHAELQQVMGFFVDMLPVRVRVDEIASFVELCRQLKGTLLDAYQHFEMPFTDPIGDNGQKGGLGAGPLFLMTFQLAPQAADSIEAGGLRLTRLSSDTEFSKFDVEMQLTDGPATLSGRIKYRSALLEQSTIRRFVGGYLAFVDSISHRPNQPIARLESVSAADVDEVLRFGAGGGRTRPTR